jgi:hypothetical protein
MSRYTHDDMPALRSMRETLRRMIDALNGFKAEETELSMLVAMASVGDELQSEYDAAGRALDRLEKTAPGAGRSPARGVAPSMPPVGRAPLPAAKGPAIATALRAASKSATSSPPAKPLSASAAAAGHPWRKSTLFSGPLGQILPAEGPAQKDQTTEGAHSHAY